MPTHNIPLPPSPYILRCHGHAVKLHTSIGGKVFTLVSPEEATRFDDPARIIKAALEHGLDVEGCEMETV